MLYCLNRPKPLIRCCYSFNPCSQKCRSWSLLRYMRSLSPSVQSDAYHCNLFTYLRHRFAKQTQSEIYSSPLVQCIVEDPASVAIWKKESGDLTPEIVQCLDLTPSPSLRKIPWSNSTSTGSLKRGCSNTTVRSSIRSISTYGPRSVFANIVLTTATGRRQRRPTTLNRHTSDSLKDW